VQFTLDGAAISGTVSYTPVDGTSTTPAGCIATLSTAISGLYPPPSARPRLRLTPLLPIALALLNIFLFALGLKWMSQARRRAYVYAGLVALVLMAIAVAGCGGGGGGGGGGGKSHSIGATYSGDTNYAKSAAVPIMINVM
jgi:hypothetical protein